MTSEHPIGNTQPSTEEFGKAESSQNLIQALDQFIAYCDRIPGIQERLQKAADELRSLAMAVDAPLEQCQCRKCGDQVLCENGVNHSYALCQNCV